MQLGKSVHITPFKDVAPAPPKRPEPAVSRRPPSGRSPGSSRHEPSSAYSAPSPDAQTNDQDEASDVYADNAFPEQDWHKRLPPRRQRAPSPEAPRRQDPEETNGFASPSEVEAGRVAVSRLTRNIVELQSVLDERRYVPFYRTQERIVDMLVRCMLSWLDFDPDEYAPMILPDDDQMDLDERAQFEQLKAERQAREEGYQRFVNTDGRCYNPELKLLSLISMRKKQFQVIEFIRKIQNKHSASDDALIKADIIPTPHQPPDKILSPRQSEAPENQDSEKWFEADDGVRTDPDEDGEVLTRPAPEKGRESPPAASVIVPEKVHESRSEDPVIEEKTPEVRRVYQLDRDIHGMLNAILRNRHFMSMNQKFLSPVDFLRACEMFGDLQKTLDTAWREKEALLTGGRINVDRGLVHRVYDDHVNHFLEAAQFLRFVRSVWGSNPASVTQLTALDQQIEFHLRAAANARAAYLQTGNYVVQRLRMLKDKPRLYKAWRRASRHECVGTCTP